MTTGKKYAQRQNTSGDTLPVEGRDFSVGPDGSAVFTESYLLRRGYCCESGCRHCPYGYSQRNDPDIPAELRRGLGDGGTLFSDEEEKFMAMADGG